MNESDFCSGFMSGVVVAGIMGFLFQRIYLASKRSQEAVSKKVMVETSRTPREVVARSRTAQFEMLALVLVVIGVLIGLLWLLGQVFP